ncbi:cation efflux family protein [Dongia mobilis]|uniref:Cation efflux family protein n=1 Tax=Dongia mobilis TaxID=578943 RepID=A0A4R6WP64_9PROT|nr:cation diffusion facilitator family transporter [Dongia mobilis]TDQ80825.1 cation efflux family protein [Dongia mobilis]
MPLDRLTTSLRRAVAIVAGANLAYFCVEFWVAHSIGSVALFADSIDFLEDTSVNLLILVALGWSVANRARVGMVLAGLLMVPAGAALWTAWEKLGEPSVPAASLLGLTGFGALVVNLGCALLLARFRAAEGSLTKAAFLSARNDALANVAIILAGSLTLFWPSVWPDVIVGIGIAVINADAAVEVWRAARRERDGGKLRA